MRSRKDTLDAKRERKYNYKKQTKHDFNISFCTRRSSRKRNDTCVYSICIAWNAWQLTPREIAFVKHPWTLLSSCNSDSPKDHTERYTDTYLYSLDMPGEESVITFIIFAKICHHLITWSALKKKLIQQLSKVRKPFKYLLHIHISLQHYEHAFSKL